MTSMKDELRRVSFFLPSSLQSGLETLKDRDGVPIAESIRRAISVYLKEKGVRPPTQTKGKTQR